MRTTCLGLAAFLLLAACESEDGSSTDEELGGESSPEMAGTSSGQAANNAGGASGVGAATGNEDAGGVGVGSDDGGGPQGGTTGASAATGGTGPASGASGGAGSSGFPWPTTNGGSSWPPFGGSSGSAGGDASGTGGAGAAGTGTTGAGTAGTDGAGTTGTEPGTSGVACPAGFESELALVLTADTVPGSVELGLASSPETPREPCGLPGDQECFNLLNAERAKAGLGPLKWDGDLADLARSHAADRSQRRYVGSQHGSSTSAAHLYENRAQFLGLKSGKFASVVENAVTGASSAGAAVRSWMGSSGHRAVIMGDGAWAPYTYAACAGNGREWNIEFGRAGGGGGFGSWWSF